MIDLAPGFTWHPSSIPHPMRSVTLGIVIHWSAGREPGDIATLDGPNVDAHFYIAKDGDRIQLLDPDSMAWHAYPFANATCIGVEHETSGEPYTAKQLDASAALVAYLCKRYSIPVAHVDPSGHDPATFRGIFGHRDLSLGGVRVDGNDHTDSVPDGTGWTTYLAAVNRHMGIGNVIVTDLSSLPGDKTLRLAVGGRYFTGWDNAAGPLRWIDRNGLKDDKAAIAWQGHVWRGAQKVTGVSRHLVAKYLDPAGA